MEFSEKTIVILSPKAWGVDSPARQLYARFLARRGNQVYFVNPPSQFNSVTPQTEEANLFVVDYRLPKPIFGLWGNSSELSQAKRILKLIAKPIDLLFSFHCSAFGDLSVFGAQKSIFYLEEWQEKAEHAQAVMRTADLVLALSSPLLASLPEGKAKKMRFEHALHPAFITAEKRSERIRANTQFTTGRLRCGYVGNLQNEFIATELFQQLIRQHPTVEFHMIGPFVKNSNLALEGNKTWEDPFVEYLMGSPNVRMYGSLMRKRMTELVQTMDLFLVCYDSEQFADKVANPQKVLEYLSTGNLVVASPTADYQDRQDLLVMAEKLEDLPERFAQSLKKVEQLNKPALKAKRLAFAQQFQYEQQLEKIAQFLD